MNPDLIASSLRREITGEVLSDEWQRCMYASDASAYEILPKCVVLPKSVEDVVKVVRFANENNIPVIARGGGSGLAGQAVGDGIIVDLTRYMNRIIEVNDNDGYVVVEPGVYKGILDAELKKHGKFLPPDPSSANFCAVGGMIATNAGGAHTVKYGTTIDYVLALDVVLANGQVIHAGPLEIGSTEWRRMVDSNSLEGRIYAQLADLLLPKREAIESGFPRVRKNSCGYRLDRVLSGNVLDLSKVFVASEGTLGIVVRAWLKMIDRPRHRALALLGFGSTLQAAEAVPKILEMNPSALELLDSTVIDLARTSSEEFAAKVPASTNCLIFAEFDGDDEKNVRASMESLQAMLGELGARLVASSGDEQEIVMIWNVRKNALAYTMKIRSGTKKPIAFMEDAAVPVDKLGLLVAKLQEVYARHGLSYVIYGHAGDGNLHTRPLLDAGRSEDRRIMEQITQDLLAVIKNVRGSVSAEHGDGLARSEFVKDVYGDELYRLFASVKSLFDPKSILNPGKKIAEAGIFIQNLRYGHAKREEASTLNWEVEQGRVGRRITGYEKELSFENEVDLCHGCGACRELNFGLRMCPVFKGLSEEVSSCRGRNNVLRWLSKVDGLAKDFSLSDEYRDVIYRYCVQCKMCLVDCPSNVNVGKSMAEARAVYAKARGLPRGYRYFVNIDKYAALGCRLAPLSNWLMRSGFFRKMIEARTGIDARKKFPAFSRRTFDRVFEDYSRKKSHHDKSVAFFCDTYIRYVDPVLGIRIVRMLERNGFNVIFPEQMSSGLPALLEGAPDLGKEIAEHNVGSLYRYAAKDVPIICFSPSSSIALKMDYLNVLDTAESRTVAENTYDIHEFLSGLQRRNELDTDFRPVEEDEVGIHFHCHTIVQGADKHVLNLLRLIPNLKFHIVEKGCCGVGGSYSFIRDNYDLAMQIGSELFNAVRQERKVYTTGESCMLQIEEGSGRKVGLTIDLLARAYGLV